MKIGPLDISNPVFLAHMAGVTDYSFRILCKEQGAGMVYSEFVSAHGIIRKNEKTVLYPNVTYHLMAGMWMDTWRLEISESIRVTENGCELFCDFPRSLHLV